MAKKKKAAKRVRDRFLEDAFVRKVQSAERRRVVKYLEKAGFDEAAVVVESMITGIDCEREGYWIEDIDGVMHCDSGYYLDYDGITCCSQCRLRAA